MTRAEHLEWAKQRALEYLPHNPTGAWTSMFSDLDKHPELKDHPGIRIGVMLMMIGKHHDMREARRFIEGFH